MRAYIIEIQSCAVYVNEDLVRCWFGFRRIFPKFNLGWVVELADYERAHDVVERGSTSTSVMVACSRSGAEALMAGKTLTGLRSVRLSNVVTVWCSYANPAAALCAPTKPPYSQNPLNHEVTFTVSACQSIKRSAIPNSK